MVASPRQVGHLLAAVAKVRPDLVAFFACLYYTFMRPAEAAALTIDSCELPAKGWGRLTLTGSAKRVGAAWTDDGAAVDHRQIKHRARDAVPIPPVLVAILRDHGTHRKLSLDIRTPSRLIGAATGTSGLISRGVRIMSYMSGSNVESAR